MDVISDPLKLEWARLNDNKDEEDKFELIKVVYDLLKPWLNSELYTQEQKAKKQDQERINLAKSLTHKDNVEIANGFFDTLLAGGASPTEIETLRRTASKYNKPLKEEKDG